MATFVENGPYTGVDPGILEGLGPLGVTDVQTDKQKETLRGFSHPEKAGP